ncbi:hypothetical protein Dsin_002866 [Dipteronia sinensis]|uniref:peroxidase n=1 Tax=Dipteronia sinensis TaxID=43782 RepID=A0AAE0B7X7_9ROSI|nr:hypothetical protein Dsin_002866 [Dipteronia sinensis]
MIDSIKAQLELVCPRTGLCADIVAVAARDSIVALGGPSWNVQLGRKDSTTASQFKCCNTNLPSPFADLTTIITAFTNKNFTAQEMVTLSGAHTIGKARCSLFRSRLYNESNIDSAYAASLKKNCSSVGGDDNLSSRWH